MFTGLIEETGIIKGIQKGSHSQVLNIQCKAILDDLEIGDSVAVNGVCLTATTLTSSGFTADVMHETLNRSSLGQLRIGSQVNLERAMKAGGRFGGHIVSGHIDGTGTVEKITKDDNAYWFKINCSPQLMKYIIMKGSITLDGISLTVAETSSRGFSVSIIPHTLKETTLGDKKPGSIINIENDCIGKYVEKMMLAGVMNDSPYQALAEEKSKSNITEAFLMENGF